MIDPFYLNILSAVLFSVAMGGIVFNLNNLVKIFLCIELMFLAVSINFISYAYAFNNLDGQIFSIILLTVAAAESAVGLGILVLYFRQRATVSMVGANLLKE